MRDLIDTSPAEFVGSVELAQLLRDTQLEDVGEVYSGEFATRRLNPEAILYMIDAASGIPKID